MKIILTLLAAFALASCLTLETHKLQDGETGCQTTNTIYGSVSTVRQRADNAGKGNSATGKVRVTCGSAVMEIDNTISAPATASKP